MTITICVGQWWYFSGGQWNRMHHYMEVKLEQAYARKTNRLVHRNVSPTDEYYDESYYEIDMVNMTQTRYWNHQIVKCLAVKRTELPTPRNWVARYGDSSARN